MVFPKCNGAPNYCRALFVSDKIKHWRTTSFLLLKTPEVFNCELFYPVPSSRTSYIFIEYEPQLPIVPEEGSIISRSFNGVGQNILVVDREEKKQDVSENIALKLTSLNTFNILVCRRRDTNNEEVDIDNASIGFETELFSTQLLEESGKYNF